MVSIYDSPNTLECNDFFVIYPNALEKQKKERLKGKNCKPNFSYTSDKNYFLDINKIKSLIKPNYEFIK